MDKIKEFVKKYKKHISGAVIVLLILVWAFWYGGNAPGARGFKLEKTEEGLTTEAVGGAELTETTKRYIYEEMIITNHEILDGESERLAYQKFGERVDLGEYQRLIRILIHRKQNIRLPLRAHRRM